MEEADPLLSLCLSKVEPPQPLLPLGQAVPVSHLSAAFRAQRAIQAGQYDVKRIARIMARHDAAPPEDDRLEPRLEPRRDAPIERFGMGVKGVLNHLGRAFPRFHDGNNLAEAMGLRLDMGGVAPGPGPGRNVEQDLDMKLSQTRCPRSPEPLNRIVV